MDIGENIRKRREELGMSQIELAKKVNVSRSMICQVESGRKPPSMVMGKYIADALGCSMDSLAV
ncbi:helix-turn-helix domain-containing protein [Parablautia intestinalis]|uniref:helix-turn-helix domain-containing protein n=1 Tax=Parablautia intestinalis TaxID=2320100 RepID=UPI00256EDB68|nr:helix-turn-helix transcriptional regulator [Parablautia intestinalis]